MKDQISVYIKKKYNILHGSSLTFKSHLKSSGLRCALHNTTFWSSSVSTCLNACNYFLHNSIDLGKRWKLKLLFVELFEQPTVLHPTIFITFNSTCT